MIEEIGEKYFIYKRIEGDYCSVNLNIIWDDLYDYLINSPYYTDYWASLPHVSILRKKNRAFYLEAGFLLAEYVKSANDIKVKKIPKGRYEIIKQTGSYTEFPSKEKKFYYREHLNRLEEVQSAFLESDVYTLIKE